MTYRVILIEDNPDHIFLISRVLADCDEIVDVDVCRSAESALERLISGNGMRGPLPHFILLDQNLPGMSGQEFLTRLRKVEALSRLPVFVLTSSGREADREQCVALGASGYFVKPFMEEDLDTLLAAMP